MFLDPEKKRGNPSMSQANNSGETKAGSEDKKKEQWLLITQFSCVKCDAIFQTREELLAHYEGSRHDKYSSWLK